MRRHWRVKLRDRIYFPPKFTGGGFDTDTETMLTEAAQILKEAGDERPR